LYILDRPIWTIKSAKFAEIHYFNKIAHLLS